MPIHTRFPARRSAMSEAYGSCRNSRRGYAPDFFKPAQQQARIGDVSYGRGAAYIIIMETAHETRVIADRKRIVNAVRGGLRLVNKNVVAELSQQQHQPGAVTHDVGCLV